MVLFWHLLGLGAVIGLLILRKKFGEDDDDGAGTL